MKYSKLISVNLLVFALFLTSCDKDDNCPNGTGSIDTISLSLSTFNAINFAIAGNVNITQGTSQSVTLTGHSSIINKIDNEVSGGVWRIDFGRDCFSNYDLIINIVVPNIEDITMSGAGNIAVGSFENQNDLSLNLSGSGAIVTDAFGGCEHLSVNLSGSGTIRGESEFPDLKTTDINISGSGNYRGFPVSMDECDVNISGSGNCELSVRQKLDVRISGSGTVSYRGNPVITTNITGSGSVVDAN